MFLVFFFGWPYLFFPNFFCDFVGRGWFPSVHVRMYTCVLPPTSHFLLEVGTSGTLPCRVPSPIRRFVMPPKSIARRGGAARSISVSATHPANVAAAKKSAGVAAISTRESPPRASKSAAIARIEADSCGKMRAPIASVAPDSAETTPGVMATIVEGRVPPQQHVASASAQSRNDCPGGDSSPVDMGETLGLLPSSFPPLWNAWWCGRCRSLHYVGDGGELSGACIHCGENNPVRNDTMLDPDEVANLKANPGLSYDKAPTTSFGQKTTVTTSEDDRVASSPEFSRTSSIDGDDYYERTDLELSKYPFLERLDHYMERNPISEENRRCVELAIMVEAGSIVREMGAMTKERREQAFHSEYMSLISEIPDERFVDVTVRQQMQLRCKGMRKGGDMSPANLHRKYESEITSLKKFAYKFPGFGNLSKLPSGTSQLQQLRRPVVAKLWAEQNPAREDLDYDDPVAIATQIPPNWWLEHSSCKYILSVLVHKDNKDISTDPAQLPAGPKRIEVRKVMKRAVEKERFNDRVQRFGRDGGGNVSVVSKKDDTDMLAKKAKIDGMRSVINLKKIEAINTQIAVMERLENVYVARMGRDAYEHKLVTLANKLPDMLEEEEEQPRDLDGIDLY